MDAASLSIDMYQEGTLLFGSVTFRIWCDKAARTQSSHYQDAIFGTQGDRQRTRLLTLPLPSMQLCNYNAL